MLTYYAGVLGPPIEALSSTCPSICACVRAQQGEDILSTTLALFSKVVKKYDLVVVGTHLQYRGTV